MSGGWSREGIPQWTGFFKGELELQRLGFLSERTTEEKPPGESEPGGELGGDVGVNKTMRKPQAGSILLDRDFSHW